MSGIEPAPDADDSGIREAGHLGGEAVAFEFGGDAGSDVPPTVGSGLVVHDLKQTSGPQDVGQHRKLSIGTARPEKVDVDGERLIELPRLTPEVGQVDLLQHRPARRNVLGVASPSPLNCGRGTVDGGDPSSVEPIAHQCNRHAWSAAELEDLIAGRDIEQVHRPCDAGRHLEGGTTHQLPETRAAAARLRKERRDAADPPPR